jgi:hypothetical protein
MLFRRSARIVLGMGLVFGLASTSLVVSCGLLAAEEARDYLGL